MEQAARHAHSHGCKRLQFVRLIKSMQLRSHSMTMPMHASLCMVLVLGPNASPDHPTLTRGRSSVMWQLNVGPHKARLVQLLLPPTADARGDRRPCTTATSALTLTLRPTTTVVESPATSQHPALTPEPAKVVELVEPWCCVCCAL